MFVALLLEIGSGFGMYVAFSSWRLYETSAPAMPDLVPVMPAVQSVVPAASMMVAQRPAAIANDNRSTAAQPMQKQTAPETDVDRFYKERIDAAEGSSLTATALYEDYCAWCEEQEKEPLALPTFGRELGELNVTKAKIAGRVRYIGIALRGSSESEGDRRLPSPVSQAA